MATHRDQRTILSQIPFAVAFQLAFVWAGYYWLPLPPPVGPQMIDRLVYAIQWYLCAVVLLIVGYFVISGMRFNSDLGRDGSDRDQRINMHVRFLRNTHEQFTIFVFGNLALLTVISPEATKLIPVLVMLFVVARVIFWVGYVKNPMYRTFGMVSTMYPTLVVLVYVAYRITAG